MDPDPDPTPDPTPIFLDFKDAEIFHTFFLNLAHRHIIFSLKNLTFCQNFALKFYFACIISVRTTLYEKREGSGSGSVSLSNGSRSRSGRPKNMRIPQIRFRIRIPNAANLDANSFT
jgi:hypothetical protein